MNIKFYILSILIGLLVISCQTTDVKPDIAEASTIDYSAVQAYNADSTVNMIVEIPAGTTAKYEMNKRTHTLQIDSIDGMPRYINYLGYPGNYGMIPGTILPIEEGGDGDPLDILLLGNTVARGSIQRVRVIGVMKLLDNGEQDDKLLAVPTTKKWKQVSDIQDLDAYFAGAKDIVSIFFTNYKAKGEMQFESWGGRAEALSILSKAHRYQEK